EGAREETCLKSFQTIELMGCIAPATKTHSGGTAIPPRPSRGGNALFRLKLFHASRLGTSVSRPLGNPHIRNRGTVRTPLACSSGKSSISGWTTSGEGGI